TGEPRAGRALAFSTRALRVDACRADEALCGLAARTGVAVSLSGVVSRRLPVSLDDRLQPAVPRHGTARLRRLRLLRARAVSLSVGSADPRRCLDLAEQHGHDGRGYD